MSKFLHYSLSRLFIIELFIRLRFQCCKTCSQLYSPFTCFQFNFSWMYSMYLLPNEFTKWKELRFSRQISCVEKPLKTSGYFSCCCCCCSSSILIAFYLLLHLAIHIGLCIRLSPLGFCPSHPTLPLSRGSQLLIYSASSFSFGLLSSKIYPALFHFQVAACFSF